MLDHFRIRLLAIYRQLLSRWRILSAGLVLGLIGILTAIVWWPEHVVFSYSEPTCTPDLTLFPAISRATSTEDFQVRFEHPVAIGSAIIATRQTCLEPTKSPESNEVTVGLAMNGWWFLQSRYEIVIPPLPSLNFEYSQPVALSKPLQFDLSIPDIYYDYWLYIGDNQQRCDIELSQIRCRIDDLELTQGQRYRMELGRKFGESDMTETVVEAEIEILKATQVVDATIEEDEIIYDKRQKVEVSFDKPITEIDIELTSKADDEVKEIATSHKVLDKVVAISWEDELPRESQFTLRVSKVEAEDGSVLAEPFERTFKTSGGPRVTGMSWPAYGVRPYSVGHIRFDQGLDLNQNPADLVKVEGVAASVDQQGNELTVKLGQVPPCTDFIVVVTANVINSYGVGGNSEWRYPSRTLCQWSEVIGHSVEGRPITAYFFGKGSQHVLFTGAIHGNERSSSYLMEHWMDELEKHYDQIPSHRRVVVIPEVNPDGLAHHTRYNARGVDLNRNFAVSDWQKDIADVNGEPLPGGGGQEAMSEPEVKALAAFTQRLRPVLTMSFHSVGGVVIANQAGNSSTLASRYASMTPYYNGTGQSSEVFDYQITGTYDDWIAEKLGLPSVLVELGSHTYSEFPSNKAALWEMVAN